MDERDNAPYCSFCGKKVKSEFELTLLDGRPCCADCLPRVRRMNTDYQAKAERLAETDRDFLELARRLESYHHHRKSSGYLALLCVVAFFAGIKIPLVDFLMVPALLVLMIAAAVFLVTLLLERIAKHRLKHRLTEPEDRGPRGPEF